MYSRSDFTDDEQKKLTAKGRRWLMDYLTKDAGADALSEKGRKQILKVIGDKYKACMLDNDIFFSAVCKFVSERRTSDEKKKFFREVTTYLVQLGVRNDWLEKYSSK